MQRPTGLPARFDGSRVRSHIEQSRSHHAAIERYWDDLLAGHEGEWVAAYAGEFRFGRTIADALAAARLAGWPLDVVAIERLARRRPAVLL
jgi:hypothetical protein